MSRTVCGECWCPYDELDGSCACPKSDKENSMTKTIDALVEALEACTTEEGPTQEELNRARAALAQARAEQAEPQPEHDGPIVDGWQLSVTEGHSGHGVYAHMTEYPDEGAVLVLPITPPAAPVAKLDPLTDAEIDGLLSDADGSAEANLKRITTEDGFPAVEFDEVDAWSKPLVVKAIRKVEAAHNAKL